MKRLKIFSFSFSSISECYYRGHYILPEQDVEDHVKSVGKTSQVKFVMINSLYSMLHSFVCFS